MDFDDRFRRKSDSIQDAPQPFGSALADSIASSESIRLLIHAPAFSTLGKKTPATVLTVTDKDWLLNSETEDGGAHSEKSDFADTLFLELASILLWGQLTIHFAAGGASRSATATFDTVEERLYQEAIDAIVDGIDPNSSRITGGYPRAGQVVRILANEISHRSATLSTQRSAAVCGNPVAGYFRRI